MSSRYARLLNAIGWKYAASELLLIVVGVTLALMANSLYLTWQDRKDESQALSQIAMALHSDLDFLQTRYEELKVHEERLVALLERLQSDDLGPESQEDFGSVRVWRGVRMRLGPYEQLKNRGLSLISDDTLRLGLVELYESDFAALQGVTNNDQIFSRDQIGPYFARVFRRVSDSQWSPIAGYGVLDDDVYFENLVSLKLDRIQDLLIPAYEEFFQSADAVLMQITSELNDAAD